MPRTREQFLQMKDDRVGSILKAALPLFSLYGTKVSINEICEKAKCSHGIVYHYFKNTNEIYGKIKSSQTLAKLRDKFDSIQTGSSYEKIEEIVSVFADVNKDNIETICFLNMIINETDKNSIFIKLCKLVKEAQNSGTVIAGEPADVVNCLFILFKGIYYSFLIEKHPNIKVPSLENVMQLIRKPISF